MAANLPVQPIAEKSGMPTLAWMQRFSQWQMVFDAVKQSGTTAQRPTSLLWVGRTYFDTDLGIPIWVKTASPAAWVDATGAAV